MKRLQRVTLEQHVGNELKRMILEQGLSLLERNGGAAPHWDAMKNELARHTMIFFQSFIKGIPIAFFIMIAMIGIFAYSCMR